VRQRERNREVFKYENRGRERERQRVPERVVVREKVCERERTNTFLNRMINEKREKLERRKRDTEKDREVK